jgi:hypothetical protein
MQHRIRVVTCPKAREETEELLHAHKNYLLAWLSCGKNWLDVLNCPLEKPQRQFNDLEPNGQARHFERWRMVAEAAHPLFRLPKPFPFGSATHKKKKSFAQGQISRDLAQ